MGLYFSLSAIIITLILSTMFFLKKKVDNKETKIYGIMLVGTTFMLFLEIYTAFLFNVGFPINNFYKFASKLVMVSYIFMNTFFSKYLLAVCYDGKKKNYVMMTSFIIATLGVLILPLDYIYQNETTIIPTGIGVAITYGYCVLFMIYQLFICLKFRKKIAFIKFSPYYIFLVLGFINFIVTLFLPASFLVGYMFFLSVLIMYHTIENPDVKMLEVYEENRELTEKSIEEKSNLLFKISEDVREPITKIESLSNNIIKSKELDYIHDNAREINQISTSVSDNINNVLDITTLDKRNIKMIDTKYNIYNIFNQIIIQIKEKSKDKNIDFKYNISSMIPTSLYGDSVKIKQIIYSMLINSVNNTDKGYIDLDVSCLNRNEVTRLIITISDTGCGIELTEINEILGNNEELKERELEKINELDTDLKVTKKIIDMLGGTLLIKSEKGKGSTFTIILNQIKEKDEEIKMTSSLSNKDSVLVIDDDYFELNKISDELRKYNYNVETTMYGPDLIEKLNNGEKYKYIFIDDEMKPNNAIELIKQIDYKKYNVVVMLSKDKEFLKDKYKEDELFDNYIIKETYKSDIERVLK